MEGGGRIGEGSCKVEGIDARPYGPPGGAKRMMMMMMITFVLGLLENLTLTLICVTCIKFDCFSSEIVPSCIVLPAKPNRIIEMAT